MTTSSSEQCVFCSIVAHNVPHHEIIWQNDTHLAFMDAMPQKRGHVLVIPKKHTDYVLHLSEQEYLDLMQAARKIAQPLKETLDASYICFVIEGRSVAHVHVHLIPLQEGDSLGMGNPIENAAEDKVYIADMVSKRIKE